MLSLMYVAAPLLFVVRVRVVIKLLSMRVMLRPPCTIWCGCGCGGVGAQESMWVCGRGPQRIECVCRAVLCMCGGRATVATATVCVCGGVGVSTQCVFVVFAGVAMPCVCVRTRYVECVIE